MFCLLALHFISSWPRFSIFGFFLVNYLQNSTCTVDEDRLRVCILLLCFRLCSYDIPAAINALDLNRLSKKIRLLLVSQHHGHVNVKLNSGQAVVWRKQSLHFCTTTTKTATVYFNEVVFPSVLGSTSPMSFPQHSPPP